MKEYLTSEDSEEREIAYRILIKDDASRLTTEFWKLLDEDTKIWLISKISEEVFKRPYHRFLEELDILIHNPEHFLERMRSYPWVYPYILPLALVGMAFYGDENILRPLWIKLRATIEAANDLTSVKRIEEIERKFKESVQWTIDKLKSILPILQRQYPYVPYVSRNILFDPSLIIDYEKARKVFNFMRRNHKEFNFFISSSCYNAFKEESRLQKVAIFFEYEKEISPRKLLKMLEEYKGYYTLFKIPREIYQKKYEDFYENLRKELNNQDLVGILFEEWVFLQEFSWIVAKSKKAFEKFKEAGAITIEFSEKTVDKIVKKTLKKKDDDFVNTFDKLRALGKWIAVGAGSITSILNPDVNIFSWIWYRNFLTFGS